MPASPPNHALRHLATAGNAAALFAVIVILANARTLFQPQPTRLFPQGLAIAQPDPKATRAILVIMDALRADSSEDAALMPNLNRLAARGIRGTARVEALIPSTVAGLRAIVEGTVVAPAEFVHDFHAARAPGGGILEAVRAAGTRSFVAGPSLWCDLYAPWIDECVVTESIAESDALLVEPAIAACADPRWHLVVVHLSAADTAAHLHGGKSAGYRRALAACDLTLGRLVEAAGPTTAVLVTSDHGVTDAGGHAGPEAAVRTIPVVFAGPGTPRPIPTLLRQAEIGRLLHSALWLPAPGFAPPRNPQSPDAVLLVLPLLALFASARIISASSLGEEPPHAAFALNASLWAVIATAFFSTPAALGLALVALAAVALGASPRPRCLAQSSMLILAGAAAGALRLADGLATVSPGSEAPALGATLALPAVCAIATFCGVLLARGLSRGGRRAAWCGGAAALLPPLLNRALGETVSLSTLNVRLAFAATDTALGVPAAVVLAVLRPHLATLCLVAALGLTTLRRREMNAASWAAFGAGIGAAFLGQSCLAGAALFGALPAGSVASMALCLLARGATELAVLFLAVALAGKLATRRAGERSQTAPVIP